MVPSTLSCNADGTLARSPATDDVSVPIVQLLCVLAAKWPQPLLGELPLAEWALLLHPTPMATSD